jgi:hypothetical protein
MINSIPAESVVQQFFTPAAGKLNLSKAESKKRLYNVTLIVTINYQEATCMGP